MKRETLEAMLEAMVEYMPAFHKYLKHKAKLWDIGMVFLV